MSEDVDGRVLGAVRFVDATTRLPVLAPLMATAPGVRWVRNRSAAWVLFEAPALDAYTGVFDPAPAAPPPLDATVDFQVADPTGAYLARRGRLRVPRDPAPASVADPSSVFRAAEFALHPSPAAPTWPGWAQIRATVPGDAAGTGLAGALLRVVRTSGPAEALIASGLIDARGEALVAVPGIPATTFDDADGPVLATEITVRVEVVHDAAAGPVPDPDVLEADRDAHTLRARTLTLAAGRVVAVTL